MTCKGLRLEEKAQSALIQSVLAYPWNWSAWLELESFVTSSHKMIAILDQLPIDHVMTKCFQIHVSVGLDLYPLETVLSLCDSVAKVFQDSSWLSAQRALIYYNHKGTGKFFLLNPRF